MNLLSRVIAVFPRTQRPRLAALQAYFVVAAMVQVLGAVSIVPFVAVVSNPSIIRTSTTLNRIYTGLGFEDERGFMIALGWFLMAMIIASNAIMALSQWISVRFSIRLGVQLQREVLRGYLHRDFEQLARDRSSQLISRATNGVSGVVYNVVMPILALNASVCVAIIIVGGLLWYDWVVALLATAIIGGGYLLVWVQLKKLLQHHGRVAWDASTYIQRLLTEILGGAKEIKLLGNESQYLDRTTNAARASAPSRELSTVLPDMPRFLLESVVLCALLGLGISLLMRSTPTGSIVSVLAVYAMAGYRLMPAAQSIFRSLSSIRGHSAVLDDILPDVLAGRAIADRPHIAESATHIPPGDIRFEGVSYRYPEAPTLAISDASFRIPRQAITAFVGRSGAGKSTLADLLLGLLRPSEGRIVAGDMDIATNLVSWRRAMGYVPQTIFLLDDSIAANITFGGPITPAQLTRVKAAASSAQLDSLIAQLPAGYDHIVGERGAQLSGGQRQRIGIARALYRDTDLLVLDEATSALDAGTERNIIDAIQAIAKERTVLLIAHRASTIRCADHLILVDQGRVVDSGTYAELWAKHSLFRELAAEGPSSEQSEVFAAAAPAGIDVPAVPISAAVRPEMSSIL